MTKSLLSIIFLSILLATACGPKEDLQPVVFRQISNIRLSGSALKGTAIFHNPNNKEMTLKRIKIDVLLEGKEAAKLDQHVNVLIPAKSDFEVPVEANISIKEIGFTDTILGVLGGKRMEIRYKGHVRGNYKGLPVRVPVDYKSEIRIKL